MNENLDLTKILANVPKGTKLFSTDLGYVTLESVNCRDTPYQITVNTHDNFTVSFTKDGFCFRQCHRDEYAEPSLYPAHDQRDWSKFEVPKNKVKVTLHPFDKVLARTGENRKWEATLITDFDKTDGEEPYLCLRYWRPYCIPYNKDTAHLLGTKDNCPIDYEIEFSKEFKDVSCDVE